MYLDAVAVWSGVNVAGTRLVSVNPDIGTEKDPENWKSLHKQVVERCGHVTKTSYFVFQKLRALYLLKGVTVGS